MKRTFLGIMLLMLPLLAGCNTVEGMGKDIQAGGRAITGAADKEKPSNNDQNAPSQ